MAREDNKLRLLAAIKQPPGAALVAYDTAELADAVQLSRSYAAQLLWELHGEGRARHMVSDSDGANLWCDPRGDRL